MVGWLTLNLRLRSDICCVSAFADAKLACELLPVTLLFCVLHHVPQLLSHRAHRNFPY
jgi:hypothetical protein